MLGTGASTLIGDFEERAPLLEVTGGFTREDAEHIAAHALGLASSRELQAAAIEHWRSLLRLANGRGEALIADALELVNSPRISALVALGWTKSLCSVATRRVAMSPVSSPHFAGKQSSPRPPTRVAIWTCMAVHGTTTASLPQSNMPV